MSIIKIEDHTRNELLGNLNSSPAQSNNFTDVFSPNEPTRTFALNQKEQVPETPKKSPSKVDSMTPYFKERNGLELTKMVLSDHQKPTLQKKEISIELCSPMKQLQHAVADNPFEAQEFELLTPDATATLSPKSNKKMPKRSTTINLP